MLLTIMVHHGMPTFQMAEGVKDPIADHGNSVMTFVELPFSTGIGNHSLHDIIGWHKVDQEWAFDLLEAGSNLW